MNDLYLLKYNNYYNRQFKKENSIANYKTASTANYGPIANVNFNKNDGISARQIINFPVGQAEFEGDYLIITEANSETIVSRWFILENRWNRNGQLELTLRRDLLVDYYDKYKNEPFFCEKGAVPVNDNFIFNPENMTYNQILQSRTPLKEGNTTCRWVVCYFAEGLVGETEVEIDDVQYIVGANVKIPTALNYASDAQPGEGIQFTIPTKETYTTKKVPYWMVAFPYDECIVRYKEDGEWKRATCPPETNTSIMDFISRKFRGSGALYDMQILSYCPLSRNDWEFTTIDNTFAIQSKKDNLKVYRQYYNLIDEAPRSIYPLGCLIPVDDPDVSFTINYTYPYNLNTIADYKVDSEARFIRLVSPNGSGVFQFNASKNGGITQFNVRMTLKPFNPVIQIVPKFGRLYNTTYGTEMRGLICQGDFSAPMTTDSWLDYQIGNKNYLNAFQRGVENMEWNQRIQLEHMKAEGEISAVSAGINTAGSMMYATGGNPIAGGLGFIAGHALSKIGLDTDLMAQKALNYEALDYTKDMFGMNMENIQALPHGLSNSGSLDITTSTQPMIEIYSASEAELNALRKKIIWNGLTIGRIGTVAEFKANGAIAPTQYVKGVLVQCENIGEDFHTANEISLELNKGVYFK